MLDTNSEEHYVLFDPLLNVKFETFPGSETNMHGLSVERHLHRDADDAE